MALARGKHIGCCFPTSFKLPYNVLNARFASGGFSALYRARLQRLATSLIVSQPRLPDHANREKLHDRYELLSMRARYQRKRERERSLFHGKLINIADVVDNLNLLLL